MKYYIIIIIILVSNNIWAQDIKEVFTSSRTDIQFVGLDFSNAKMVGIHGFKDTSKLHQHLLGAWNGLFFSEPHKYDVRSAFKKLQMDYDFAVVEDVNRKLKPGDLITNNNPRSFSKEKIQSIVSGYNTEGMEADFGLSFIVHSFNKYQERGYIYVVIFDTKTRNVLLSKRMSGEAGGWGMRNYWARTYYNVLEDIRDFAFRNWKRELLESEG